MGTERNCSNCDYNMKGREICGHCGVNYNKWTKVPFEAPPREFNFLKDITALKLVKDRACRERLNFYVDEMINLSEEKKIFLIQKEGDPLWIDWLIAKGYIEEVIPKRRLPQKGEIWYHPGLNENLLCIYASITSIDKFHFACKQGNTCSARDENYVYENMKLSYRGVHKGGFTF